MAPGPAAGNETPSSIRPSAVGRAKAWYGRHRPEVLLVALAITIPELLTGSTPVLTLWDPVAVLGLLGLYGSGVLLVRDLSLRWKSGWLGVLFLGLAYGIAEEGLATKTMVDPHSSAAAFLGTYGHFLGVNWVFAVVIAIFHAVYSIGLPILLVELRYPSTQGHRFLSDRGEGWALLFLSATVVFGFFAFDRYFEGFAVLAFLLLVLAGLVAVAWRVPAGWPNASSPAPTRSPRWFFGLGLAFSVGWLFFYFVMPHLSSIPLLSIAGEILSATAVLLVGVRTVGREGRAQHAVYFAAGALAWLIPWDVLITFLLADYPVLLVTAVVFWFLRQLTRQTASRAPAASAAPPSAPVPGSPQPSERRDNELSTTEVDERPMASAPAMGNTW